MRSSRVSREGGGGGHHQVEENGENMELWVPEVTSTHRPLCATVCGQSRASPALSRPSGRPCPSVCGCRHAARTRRTQGDEGSCVMSSRSQTDCCRVRSLQLVCLLSLPPYLTPSLPLYFSFFFGFLLPSASWSAVVRTAGCCENKEDSCCGGCH